MIVTSMAGMKELAPEEEVYGDLEIARGSPLSSSEPSNDELEKAGFIGSILLALFCLVRAMDMLAQNRYVIHPFGGAKHYSVAPALICYAALGSFFLLVSPWFTAMFVNRGAAGLGRLVSACVGWLLILLSAVPVVTALSGFPPVGYTANFFADVVDPLPSAYGPAGAGILLLLGARFAAKIRLN